MMDQTYLYVLAGFFIFLMGCDYITTEHAVTKFGSKVREANPSPVMQYLAGKPKLHFVIKAFAIGSITGATILLSSSSIFASMVVLYVGCILTGVVQINNLRVIFEEQSPCG